MEEGCSSYVNILGNIQKKRTPNSNQQHRINKKRARKGTAAIASDNDQIPSNIEELVSTTIFPDQQDASPSHVAQDQQQKNAAFHAPNPPTITKKRRRLSVYKRKTSDLVLPTQSINPAMNSSLSNFGKQVNMAPGLMHQSYVIPPPNEKCPHCSAIVWKEEMIKELSK